MKCLFRIQTLDFESTVWVLDEVLAVGVSLLWHVCACIHIPSVSLVVSKRLFYLFICGAKNWNQCLTHLGKHCTTELQPQPLPHSWRPEWGNVCMDRCSAVTPNRSGLIQLPGLGSKGRAVCVYTKCTPHPSVHINTHTHNLYLVLISLI